MLSAYDLAKTLGVLPGGQYPLRPDEIDAEIVYNKMQDPNRSIMERIGSHASPTDWEGSYVPVTKDMAQKVREFTGDLQGNQ